MNILKKASVRTMTVLLAFAAVFSALTLLSPGMRAEAAGAPSAQIVSWETKDQSRQLRLGEVLYLDIQGFDTVTSIDWNNNFPRPRWVLIPFTDTCADIIPSSNTLYMGWNFMAESRSKTTEGKYRWFVLTENGPLNYWLSAKVTGTVDGQTVSVSTRYTNFAAANLQKDMEGGAYSLWLGEEMSAKRMLAEAGVAHVVCDYTSLTRATSGDSSIVSSVNDTVISIPDFKLTGEKVGATTITLTLAKTTVCAFHPGQTASGTVAIGVFKKPGISVTPMSITLTGTDAGCTYTINGESKTCKTDNETLVFEDLQPDTPYNLELSRQTNRGRVSKNVTVDTAKAYQLRYSANGGMEDPENQLPGATSIEADLAITNIIPTRDSYVFTGWSRYANGYVEHQALSDEEAKANGYYASAASVKGTDDAAAVPYRTSIEKLFGLKIELSDHKDPTPTKTTYMGNTVLFAQWQPMVAEVAIQLQKDDKPLTKALTDEHKVDLYRAGALAYRLEAANETGKYSNQTVQNGTYSIYVDGQDTGKTVTVASVATGLRTYTKGNTSMTLNYYDVKLSVTLDEAAWAGKSVALYRPYASTDASGNPITAYAKKYDLTEDTVTPGLYHFEDLQLGAVANDYDIFVDGEGTALTDTTENIVVDKLGAKNTNARDVRYFNAQIPVTLDGADWTSPTITLTRTAKNVDKGATTDSVDKTYTLAYDPALHYYTGIVQEGKYELYAGYAYYFNGDKSLASTFVTLSGAKTGDATRMSTQLFYYAARPDAPIVTTEERQKVDDLGQPVVDKDNNPVMEQVKVEHVYTEKTPLEVFTLSFCDSSDPNTAVRYELAAYNAFLPQLVQKGTQVYSPGNPTKRNSKFQRWVNGGGTGDAYQVFAKSDTATPLLIDKATNVYSEWNSPLVTLHAYVKGGDQGKYAFPDLTLTQFDRINVTNATVRFYRGTVQPNGSLLYDENPITDEKWAYASLAESLPIGTDYLVFTEKADGGIQMNIDFPKMATPAQAQDLLEEIQYTVKLPADETNTYYRVELKVYGDAGTAVTFDLNDEGSGNAKWVINGADVTTYSQTVNTMDESGKGLVVQPGDPQWQYHVFDKWCLKNESGDFVPFHFATDAVTDGETLTLYATWNADSNNELTFDINGGTLVKKGGEWKGPDSPIQRVYLSNPYAVEPGATRTGYLFDGWYTELTDGTKFNFVTNTVKAPQTMYAHWTARTYEVRMELDGGSFTDASQLLTLPHTYDAPTDLPGVERRGYDFTGWTYPVYTRDDSASDWGATANSTYYVYDDPTSSYVLAVTFDDDATYYTAATQNISLTMDPGGDASKDKYILPGDAIVSNNALTATWEAQKYAITYDKMDGIDTSSYPAKHTFGVGTTLPVAPTKAGHVFEGWYVPVVADKDTFTSYYVCDASGVFNTATGAFDNSTTYYQPVTVLDGSVYLEDITVTAGWNVAHTVTFDLAGGTWAGGSGIADTATVGNGRLVTKPDGGKDPTQSGYLFNGWVSGGTEFDFDTTPITGGITLTAQWALAETVTLDANLGNAPGDKDGFEIQLTPGDPDAIPPVAPTFKYEKTQTVDAPVGGLMPSITAPRRVGYTFDGWFWYKPLSSAPGDWNSTFADYYISDGADGYKHPEPTYVAPAFAAGKYFVIREDNTFAPAYQLYVSTPDAPADWPTGYYTEASGVYTAVASDAAYAASTAYYTMTNWGADMSAYRVRNADGTYTPVAPGEAYDSAKTYVTLAYDRLVADPDTLMTEPVPAIPFAPEYTEHVLTAEPDNWGTVAYYTLVDGKYTPVASGTTYTNGTYYTLANWDSTAKTYYTMDASFVLAAVTAGDAFDPTKDYYTIGTPLTWATDWKKSLEEDTATPGSYKPAAGTPVPPAFIPDGVYTYVKWTLTDEKNEGGIVTTPADTVDTGKPGTLYAKWTLTPPTP